MFEAFELVLLVLGLGGAAWLGLRVPLGSTPPRDFAAEYERLAREYHASRMPYVLYLAVGKSAPPEEKAKHDRALAAYADFLRGLGQEGFVAVAMHLDRKASEAGSAAPFDHVCEFLLKEQELVGKNAKEACGHRERFAIGFDPRYLLHIPFRPARA